MDKVKYKDNIFVTMLLRLLYIYITIGKRVKLGGKLIFSNFYFHNFNFIQILLDIFNLI